MIYLFTISIALSSLLSLLLFTKKGKRLDHYLLAIFFLMATINVSYLFMVYQNNGILYLPVLSEFHNFLTVFYGTLVFFYIRAYIESEFELNKNDVAHVLPGVLVILLILTNRYTNTMMISDYYMVYFIKLTTNISYLLAALFILGQLKKSNLKNKNRSAQQAWLRWLVVGGLVLCFISFTGFLLNKVNRSLAPMSGDYLLGAFLSLYLFLLVFFVFRNTNVFQKQWASGYLISTKTNATEYGLFSDLLFYMESEKPYLDAELSLHRLSQLTSIPSGRLTRLIISNGHANFHEFVNRYRVKEVQQKLVTGKQNHFSLLGMALDSGFNSKASFNRTFKKIVGVTPSAYRTQIEKQIKTKR